MESVFVGAQKLSASQEQYIAATTTSLQQLVRQVRNIREKCSSDGLMGINIATIECAEASNVINNQLKQYHGSISKYSKLLDKAVEPYIDITPPADEDSSVTDAAITLAIEYLSRFGYNNTIHALQAAGYHVSPAEENYLQQMSTIIQSLKLHQYDVALAWTEEHQMALGEDYFKLKFHFDKLQYLQYIVRGQQGEAVEFARTVLYTHYAKFPVELGELMLLLLQAPAAEDTKKLLQTALDITTSEFINGTAKCMGLPRANHLTTLMQAGVEVVPKVKRMLQLKAQASPSVSSSQLTQWSDLSTLTLDFSTDSYSYHSVFSCPVSRDVATPDNLPVLLLCGHVICKSSLKNLPKRGNRFKCPTCYCDMTADDVMDIYL